MTADSKKKSPCDCAPPPNYWALSHRWLALVPEHWQTLIVAVDDATKRVLYAQFVDGVEVGTTLLGSVHRDRAPARPTSRLTGPFTESGQITCQNRPDRSLVNNRATAGYFES